MENVGLASILLHVHRGQQAEEVEQDFSTIVGSAAAMQQKCCNGKLR